MFSFPEGRIPKAVFCIFFLTQREENVNIKAMTISCGSKRVPCQRPTESVRHRLKADMGGDRGKCVRERRGDPVGRVKATSEKSEWNRGISPPLEQFRGGVFCPHF